LLLLFRFLRRLFSLEALDSDQTLRFGLSLEVAEGLKLLSDLWLESRLLQEPLLLLLDFLFNLLLPYLSTVAPERLPTLGCLDGFQGPLLLLKLVKVALCDDW